MTSALLGTLATSIFIQLCGVLSGVVMARGLGPAGRGEFASVILWPGTIEGLVDLGMVASITYFGAKGSPREVLGNTIAITLAQTVVLVAGGAWAVSMALSGYGDGTVRAAQIYVVAMAYTLWIEHGLAFLNGRMRFRSFNGLRLVAVGCSTGGVVGLAIVGQLTVLNVVLMMTLVALATLGVTLVVVWRTGEAHWRSDGRLRQQMLLYGVKVYPGHLSGMFQGNLNQLVISVALAPAAMGLYAIATTLAAPIGLLGTTAMLVVIPAMARAGSPAEQRLIAGRVVRLSLWAGALVVVLLLLWVPGIVELFFGARFPAAQHAAGLLLVASILVNTSVVLVAVLKGLNLPGVASKAQVANLVITAIAIAALLGPFGIEGAALAALLGSATNCLALGFVVCRALNMPAWEILLVQMSDLAYLLAQLHTVLRSIARGRVAALPTRDDGSPR